MRLGQHPELLDRLAAQYALGVLRGGARRRLERMAADDAAVHAAIRGWQARLAGLAELQPAAMPVDKVWCGIESRLGWKPAATPAVPWWRRLWAAPAFWRGAAASLAAVAALTVGLSLWLARQQDTAPPLAAMAVLNDVDARPAVLVTWDRQARMLTVRRLDHLALTEHQVLQLWALPPGAKPQSLGLIGQRREVRLPVPRASAAAPALAISIEPPGGSPNPDGPSGPVVFSGKVVRNPL